MIDGHIKIPLRVMLSPKQSGTYNYGSLNRSAVYYVGVSNNTLDSVKINITDVISMLQPFTPTLIGCNMEIAVRKLQVWGPLSTASRSPELVVALDMGSNTNSLAITDVGTLMTRARCGITIPYEIWHCGSYTFCQIDFDNVTAADTPDRWDKTKTQDIGLVYITVHYRITPVTNAIT